MTGILNSEQKAKVVVSPTEFAAKLGTYSVFGSVHGHAQSIVVIRADTKCVASPSQPGSEVSRPKRNVARP